MRYHQLQGHFRQFTTQLRESTQNNQDCQTPSLFRQPILQTTGLSQNPDSQKSETQKSGNKQGLSFSIHCILDVDTSVGGPRVSDASDAICWVLVLCRW